MKRRLRQVAAGVLLVNLAVLLYFKSGNDSGIILSEEQDVNIGLSPGTDILDRNIGLQQYENLAGDVRLINESPVRLGEKSSGTALQNGRLDASPADTAKDNQTASPQKQVPFVDGQSREDRGPNGDAGVHNSCGALRAPITPVHPSWQAVVHNNTYVYSAFYDNRTSGAPVIKIIGISQQETRRGLFHCQVWFPGRNHGQQPSLKIVSADVDIIPETHERRYAVFFYLCQLDTDQVPFAVSLVMERCESPLNVLAIPKPPAVPLANFTVCVTPLNFHYNNVYQLVEMVEVNRMLGADKVVFYNHTTGPQVDKVLSRYSRMGVVDVQQWRVPVNVDVWPHVDDLEIEVHYFAQLAALNDCLYRHMYRSRFLVFTDLDEFIVPRTQRSWYKFLLSISHKSNQELQYGCYLFQNVFFKTEWPNDPFFEQMAAVHDYRMTALLKSKREMYVWPHGSRSKYIIDPRTGDMLGVHMVWKFAASHHQCYEVPEQEALLHHYRFWEDPTLKDYVRDLTIHTFKEDIISRVVSVHKLLNTTVADPSTLDT